MLIQQFREAVYHTFTRRPDASFDLLDALTGAPGADAPVTLSAEPAFRRRFSSIYDALGNGTCDEAQLKELRYDAQPADATPIAGYAVYAIDTTPHIRSDAPTLPDRSPLKTDAREPARIGLKFSWLMRLVERGTSWVAPLDVQRVPTTHTANQVAAAQVQVLDGASPQPKVVVADSGYGNHVFLAIFLLVRTVVALVRLRCNQTLFERPVPKPAGLKGPARKHGARFHLAHPEREPDRCETWQFAGQTVRLRAWLGLHLRQLPTLVGLVLCVEFLKADGTPRYQRPLWLFWTGPATVRLADLCQMYLWRFAIEHAFRFLKQHLRLNANQSTNETSIERWLWLCALAYWQLLLMRPAVVDLRPAWQPRTVNGEPRPLTPGQVQRGAGRLLRQLGTPAVPPRPAGKGTGRRPGYHPAPRPRYKVVWKSAPPAKTAANQVVATG